jgi:hypothetical protein
METENKSGQENPEAEPIEEGKKTWIAKLVTVGPAGYEDKFFFDDGLGELVIGSLIFLLSLIARNVKTSNLLDSLQSVFFLGFCLFVCFILRSIRNVLINRGSLVKMYYSRDHQVERNKNRTIFGVLGVVVSVIVSYMIGYELIIRHDGSTGYYTPFPIRYLVVTLFLVFRQGFQYRKPRYFFLGYLYIAIDIFGALYLPHDKISNFMATGCWGVSIFLVGVIVFLRFLKKTGLLKRDHGN